MMVYTTHKTVSHHNVSHIYPRIAADMQSHAVLHTQNTLKRSGKMQSNTSVCRSGTRILQHSASIAGLDASEEVYGEETTTDRLLYRG